MNYQSQKLHKSAIKLRQRIYSLRENQESVTLDILSTVGAGERTDQEPIQRGEITFQVIRMVTGTEFLVLSIV